MDALISHVKISASKADEAGRKKIIDGLRDLAFSIESSQDTMQRIMFQVLNLYCNSALFTSSSRLLVVLLETDC